jgi:hypothetical protein
VQFDGRRKDAAATTHHLLAYGGFGESGNRCGDHGVARRQRRHGQWNHGI